MAVATGRTYTPEDLLTMDGGEHYELVRGRLLETGMGSEADWIAGNLFGLLFMWNRATKYGWLLGAEASYQCFGSEPGRVRRPDVSLIRAGRLPGGSVPRGHIGVAPDLAIEVVSPNDTYSEVRAKADEYLAAGVQLVWIVDPDPRSIDVLRTGGGVARLREQDMLSGEELLPGFSCRVGDLFAPAAGPGGAA